MNYFYNPRSVTALIKMMLLFLLITTVTAYANVTLNQGNVLIQNVTSPQLYVFCNQTNTILALDRVNVDHSGMQAGWSSMLPARLCSVFLTDKSPFIFECRQKYLATLNAIDCQQVLLVSRLPWSGETLNEKSMTGSYWLTESISPDEIAIMLRYRGLDI